MFLGVLYLLLVAAIGAILPAGVGILMRRWGVESDHWVYGVMGAISVAEVVAFVLILQHYYPK